MLLFGRDAGPALRRQISPERAHIHHYLTLAALAHPHVAFTFTTDSRTIFQLPAAPPASSTLKPFECASRAIIAPLSRISAGSTGVSDNVK